MTDTEPSLAIKRKYNDLSLDLNLDQVTADEAWANYDNIKLKYTLEVGLASVCYLVHLLPVTSLDTWAPRGQVRGPRETRTTVSVSNIAVGGADLTLSSIQAVC